MLFGFFCHYRGVIVVLSLAISALSVALEPHHFKAHLETLSQNMNLRNGTALAQGDFDKDGLPDLVIGYGLDQNGAVSILPGRPDSVYPNQKIVKKSNKDFMYGSPFDLPNAYLELPVIPKYMESGDFDGSVKVKWSS